MFFHSRVHLFVRSFYNYFFVCFLCLLTCRLCGLCISLCSPCDDTHILFSVVSQRRLTSHSFNPGLRQSLCDGSGAWWRRSREYSNKSETWSLSRAFLVPRRGLCASCSHSPSCFVDKRRPCPLFSGYFQKRRVFSLGILKKSAWTRSVFESYLTVHT